MKSHREAASQILVWLEKRGSKRNREGMARYAITSPKVFGVSMTNMRGLAKRYGRDHELAALLWDSGWHEARILAAFIEDPTLVTARQMDGWVLDFDNWAVCDTVCFHLFDKTPHAWSKVRRWSHRRQEFVKRAAFALLASLALHDRHAPDAAFVGSLRFVEHGAQDERNFVKKGVSWALRGIGHRNRRLHAAAVALARRLAQSPEPPARWVGKDALRDLQRPIVKERLAKR